ncbi:hypothetical protein [Paraliomyxa miuraensis]|uniref:hypothetical protein n=1 Tax=Paraliomyxa miuraensis TaxID=376150 RepID=UPI0022568A91|nr:hypothetical protein [Paraliomyxa miuraensis]MCX4244531.1 hypothetical protein [Paraliomyxa miuraensis]
MTPSVSLLRRFDARGYELWLVPALVAAIGGVTLASAGADAGVLRGLVFVGGPLLLLSGLHARLDGYLHARARLSLLPLPLPPARSWAAASGPHRVGLGWTGLFGVATVAGAALGAGVTTRQALGLVGDFAWLWLLAAGLEPVIPAAGAWLGRRFPEERPQRRWQERLGGGWTIPEAVVHLYAPALGVGTAALLAMPGQLWLDLWVDGQAPPIELLVVGAIAGVLAWGLGRVAVLAYARGMFEAVPWVHEAVRTLAGPAVPEEVPRWLLWGRDPMQHLVVRQFWRVTPVPGLRLWALLIGAAWVGLAAAPSVAATAVVVALASAWLVPGVRLRALGPARARLAGSLPLPPSARAGRSLGAWAVLGAPVVVAAAGVVLAWSRAA